MRTDMVRILVDINLLKILKSWITKLLTLRA